MEPWLTWEFMTRDRAIARFCVQKKRFAAFRAHSFYPGSNDGGREEGGDESLVVTNQSTHRPAIHKGSCSPGSFLFHPFAKVSCEDRIDEFGETQMTRQGPPGAARDSSHRSGWVPPSNRQRDPVHSIFGCSYCVFDVHVGTNEIVARFRREDCFDMPHENDKELAQKRIGQPRVNGNLNLSRSLGT